MGANYDNGMREVNGMRNDIINEFRRLSPNAAYIPPPPPAPAPAMGAPAMGIPAVPMPPPPMSEHPDVVAPASEGTGGAGSAAMSIASEGTNSAGSAAMSIATGTTVQAVPIVAEAMDIDNEIPVPAAIPEPVPAAVPEPVPAAVPKPVVFPPAPQDPFHVGGQAEIPVAEGLIPQEPNFINLGDADEPLLEQLFPDKVDGATATPTATPTASSISRGVSTVDFDNATRPLELEYQQPPTQPEVTPPPEEILPGERRNPRGPEEIIPNQEQITHRNLEGASTRSSPAISESLDEILPGERRNPRGPEEIIPDQEQITHQPELNQEEEDDRQLARRPQAWQEYAEQARLDRGLTPSRPPGMHLADMAAAMDNGTRRRGRGINNRPSIPRQPAPQLPPPAPVFDQTNQQNMLEHMSTTSGGATGTIPGFPEVPEDPDFLEFLNSNFPDYGGLLNNPITINDYLNPTTSPSSPQLQLEYQGQQTSPEPQAVVPEPQAVVPEPPAPAAAPLEEVVPAPLVEVVPAPNAGASGTTAKPRSPRRSSSPQTNPSRLIAPNTPAEGLDTTMGESARDPRSQTPDARTASPEEEDVEKAVPTKGPLAIRRNTITAKKRANELAKARKAAQSQSPTASADIVQRARRSARTNKPPQVSPETSIPSQQMPTDEEETESENISDAQIRRRRRRSDPRNKTSSSSEQNSSEHNSDQGPSQPRQPSQPKRPSQPRLPNPYGAGRSLADRALAQGAYKKAYDDAPDRSLLVSRRDLPRGLPPGVGSLAGFQKYIKQRNEAEGVQSKNARSIKMKIARDAALTNLLDNDPSAQRLSVKELVSLLSFKKIG
jgi:hypothetical protein